MPKTTKEPKKPPSVPAEAKYDAATEEWELGAYDKNGKPTGEWRYWWRTTGHLCCVAHFEDGGRKNTYTRFHPDGTYSCKGILIGDNPAPGEVIYYQKSKNPTTELAISGPEYAKVFRVEETYIRKGLSKWKNFDAKGRRIEMDGTLIPQLDVKKYAANLRPFEVPAILAQLVEFQNDVGAERFAEGFYLDVDDKGLFKGFCDPRGERIASGAKVKKFLAQLLPIATATGTGSVYAAWNRAGSKTVEDMPVLVFGDEGGVHVVAENLRELLAIVGADVEPMVDSDDVSYYRAKDHEPSPEFEAFRSWLSSTAGVKPAKSPDAVVKRARKRYGDELVRWLASFA